MDDFFQVASLANYKATMTDDVNIMALSAASTMKPSSASLSCCGSPAGTGF
ncbi:hypothetical protein [Novacetimonas hansenii]|uniref:hypothetical protein n=1 Tax=Novacetimonas hansenii TaxID=436 RepID=UPI000A75DE42|nr:hypothetical protein [Novacetimonas hansenii]